MYYSKMLSQILCIFVIGLESARAVPPVANIEDRPVQDVKASRGRVSDGSVHIGGWILSINADITRIYKVPVSIEWPYVNANRTTDEQPKASLVVEPSQTLRETLNEFVARGGRPLTWGHIESIIVVRPPESASSVENTLDTKIDLSITGVSTWDAFVAVGMAANANPLHGRKINIFPHFTTDGMAEPAGFRDKKEITLELENVTAREAVCAIINQSSFELSYRYGNFYSERYADKTNPTATMVIQVYIDGKRYYTHDMMPREDIMRYNMESKVMMGEMEKP